MTLENLRRKIDKGVYVNLINTNKFKTNLISIYIIRPLKKDEVTKNALIPLVLKQGTEKYNTSLEIQKKLESLYGANLSIDVSKKGERQLIRISIEVVDKAFVEEKDLLSEVISILNEVVNNPYTENGFFSQKYVSQEKENLRKRISGRINDKQTYAVDRCIEEMCKNERFSLFKYGYEDDLDGISSEDLYSHYNNIMETSPIEISIIGDISIDDAVSEINNNFNFNRGEIVNIPREDVLKEAHTKNMIYEDMDINQGKLTLGLRTNIPYESNLYEALLLGNKILGGGPNSKLFRTVREEESLAYYIYSQSYKYKSIMIITAGIEFKNFDKTLDIIKNQIDELREGKFTEDEIEEFKNSTVTAIRSMTDSNYSLSEFYLSQSLTQDSRDIYQIIEDIRNVKKEQIVKATEKIHLDTIYFLRKKD